MSHECDVNVTIVAAILWSFLLFTFTRCEFLHKLLSNHYKAELSWWGLRPILLNEKKDMNLEGSLILSQFTRIVVSDSVLRLMSPLNMGSWPGLQYRAWVSFCGAGLNSWQKVDGYTCNIGTTIVLCLTMPDINTVQGFQAKVRLWMTCSLSKLHNTLKYYENISTGRRLPSQYCLDSSMFCIQCVWCHQQEKKKTSYPFLVGH